MEELVGKYMFIDNFETRDVNNKKEQYDCIDSIRKQLKEYCCHIDKLQQEFEANYDYLQYQNPLKLMEYNFKDEPGCLWFSMDFTILKDFIEVQSKRIIEDMQKDSNLIAFFLKGISLASELHNHFWNVDSNSIYPVQFDFYGSTSKLKVRDEKTHFNKELGEIMHEFKDIELKSFSFHFYPFEKEVLCPFCKEWIPFSGNNTINKFGKEIVLHFDKRIEKDVYFTHNPLKTTQFKEKEGILQVNYTNYTQEHLNILEIFYMLVNDEELVSNFKHVGERQLQMIDTEINFLIEDHKPIGYTYWNKASTTEGEIDCIRQLYVLPEHRNQGYAKKLLKHKIDGIDIFITETPNEISFHIIETYFKEKHKGSIICG